MLGTGGSGRGRRRDISGWIGGMTLMNSRILSAMHCLLSRQCSVSEI